MFVEIHIAFLCETYAGLIAGAFAAGPEEAAPFFAGHIRPWAARMFADLEKAEAAQAEAAPEASPPAPAPMPEDVTAPPPETAPEPPPEPAASVAEEPVPASEPAAAPEPAQAETVVQGPVIQPVSVDALGEDAPRRRGWWKR